MKSELSPMERWNKRYASQTLTWSTEPNETLVAEVKSMVPGKVLDVGCGEGRNARWLAKQGWQVTAVDFSAVAIEKASRSAESQTSNPNWRVQDVALQAPEADDYDLVIVLVLHTDPAERRAWLTHVWSALRPGGVFLYIGHAPSNIKRGVGGPQNPQLLPDATELTATLDHCQIAKAEVVVRELARDPGHSSTLSGCAEDLVVRLIKEA